MWGDNRGKSECQKNKKATHLKRLSCLKVVIWTLQTQWHQRDFFSRDVPHFRASSWTKSPTSLSHYIKSINVSALINLVNGRYPPCTPDICLFTSSYIRYTLPSRQPLAPKEFIWLQKKTGF